MHKEILKKIGLLDKEAEVYIKCLELGPQTASLISRKTNISRPLIYNIFEKLIKKGLANKSNIGSTTYFEVINPENLVDYLEKEEKEFLRKNQKQKNELELIIPSLKSLQSTYQKKTTVKFFEGKKALRQAYEDTLSSSEPIRAYANIEEMHKGLPFFFPEYYERRTKAGIFIYTICPNNESSVKRQKLDKKELREIRLIDKELYSFGPEMNVYEDKVIFASWKEEMAIVITSKEIADLHKKTFDALWNKL